MRHNAKLLCATLTAFIMLVMMAGAAVAGPLEDGIAAYDRGDYATALRLFRPLAQQGVAEAQHNVGLMYYNGKGVPQDYSEAAKWYRAAANHGMAIAQFDAGVMYRKGQGVPQDYTEAMKWYRKAADQGFDGAQLSVGLMYGLGQGVPKNYVRAHMWLNLAASRSPASEKETNDNAIKARDAIAAKMTPAQIAEALKLAREWKPKPER